MTQWVLKYEFLMPKYPARQHSIACSTKDKMQKTIKELRNYYGAANFKVISAVEAKLEA